MKVTSLLGRLVGGSEDEKQAGDGAADVPAADPSHVCTSCGEEYYADPSTVIRECRSCGGVKVEAS